MNPAIHNWKEIPENTKNALWDRQLKVNFRFSEGKHELVKNAIRMMGESFRRWRSELNTKYIQKGLTPFNEFGKITSSQWEELVAQKTSSEALELSARNTALAKRNKHHHHLGPGGYYAKEEQFRKMDEEAATAGNIDVTNLKVRSRN